MFYRFASFMNSIYGWVLILIIFICFCAYSIVKLIVTIQEYKVARIGKWDKSPWYNDVSHTNFIGRIFAYSVMTIGTAYIVISELNRLI